MGSRAVRCSICGRVTPEPTTCSLCGSPCCPMCYDRARSVCVKCLKRRSGENINDGSRGDDIFGPMK